METYTNNNKKPEITVIIPSYNVEEYIGECLESLKKQTFTDFEVLCVDDGSDDRTVDIIKEYAVSDPRFQYVGMDHCGKAGLMRNEGIKRAKGEYLLLLNNDTEVITPDWMEELLMYAMRKDVGVVGAKLYYPDKTIQHAGIVIGLGAHRTAGHTHYRIPEANVGYMGRLCYAQDVTAVTGACMMVSKALYEELGGLDESFTVALNDVDFCLRVREKGFLNIFTPFAELYHYESKSRGSDKKDERALRYQQESDRFRVKWADALAKGDPYYNPNFSLDHSDFTVNWKKPKQ